MVQKDFKITSYYAIFGDDLWMMTIAIAYFVK